MESIKFSCGPGFQPAILAHTRGAKSVNGLADVIEQIGDPNDRIALWL